MLPPGKIVLTTEQEPTLPGVLPHIFHDEIQRDQFIWLAMTFNKKAKKPEIVRKVSAYHEDRWEFHNNGMYDGRFTPETDEETVTKAFIADGMKNAVSRKKNAKPFPHSNYQVPLFPKLWVRSPTQASGELDKIVGFPVVSKGLRRQLKELPFNTRDLDPSCGKSWPSWSTRQHCNPPAPS